MPKSMESPEPQPHSRRLFLTNELGHRKLSRVDRLDTYHRQPLHLSGLIYRILR